jgi:hypothetical protein
LNVREVGDNDITQFQRRTPILTKFGIWDQLNELISKIKSIFQSAFTLKVKFKVKGRGTL